jgi:hypothetical protein
LPVTGRPHTFQVPRRRLDRAGVQHHRLHDDGGDLVGPGVEHRLDGSKVVPRQGDRVLEPIGELTFAHRNRLTLGSHAGENVVEPSVVVPGEPHDQALSGVRPRRPEGRLHRLGPRHGEPDPVGPTDGAQHSFGGFDLQLVLGSVDHAFPAGCVHCVEDCIGCMAEEVRALAEEVVDVLVAVDIDEARAFGVAEEDLRTGQAHVGVHAAGCQITCSFRQLAGSGGRVVRHEIQSVRNIEEYVTI